MHGTTLIKPVSDSTTAFQVQNAAGTSLFNVDTTHGEVDVVGGTPLYFGGVSLIQEVASSGLYIGAYDSAEHIGLEAGALYYDDINNSYATEFSISNGGQALFQNATNSHAAFQIQDSAGNNVLTADTTNRNIAVGTGSSLGSTIYSAAGDTLYLKVGTSDSPSNTSDINFNNGRAYVGYDGTTNRAFLEGSTDKGLELVVDGNFTTPAVVINPDGHVTFQNSTDYTNAFQIQSSDGTALFTADTTDKALAVSQSVPLNFGGYGSIEENSFTNLTMTETNGGLVLQSQYLNFNDVYNSYATEFAIKSGGQALFQNAVNSTTAFSIQNVGGINLLNVDTATTSGSRQGIVSVGTSNTSATLLVLDTKTSSGDPTGTNGAMYYNSSLGAFRCYQNSTWVNCVGGPGTVTLQSAYNAGYAINIPNGGNSVQINAAGSGGEAILLTSPSGNSPLIDWDNGTSQFGIRSDDDSLKIGAWQSDGSFGNNMALYTDGSLGLQNSTDSTSAFTIQDAENNYLLAVDTSNHVVSVNSGTELSVGNGYLYQNGNGDLRIGSSSNTVVLQNNSNDDAAFRVQDASNNVVLNVNTNEDTVNIVGNGTGYGGGRLSFGDYDKTSSQTVFIGEYGTTDTDALQLNGANGIVLTTGSYTSPLEIASFYIDSNFDHMQLGENASSTGSGIDLFEGSVSATTPNWEIGTDNDSTCGLGGGDRNLYFYTTAGGCALQFSYDGNATFYSSGSAHGFQVLGYASTSAFDVDTTNNRVGINNAAPGNLLSVGALTTAQGTYQVAVSTGGTTKSGIVVQTVAGQSSGYILQAQNNSGTTLASIDYQGNLSVKSATVNGNLTVTGHLITGGSTPTATKTTNIGTTGTCTISGTDTAGTITVHPGGSGIGGGDLCTITFSTAYGATPNVVIGAGGPNTATQDPYSDNVGTSSFQIGTVTAPSSGQNYYFTYIIAQ